MSKRGVSPVAALYVEEHGVYAQLPGVDPWPESRDARLYAGPNPVVAHPPCNLWGNLAAVNWARYGRQRPAWQGGSDGGCFRAALAAVRAWGGVLEHPAFTHAWELYGLARPSATGWVQAAANEWVCEVWQSAYGHPARKRTWLYYVGAARPRALNWTRTAGVAAIGGGKTGECANRRKVEKAAARATPPAFARALVQLARGAWQKPRATRSRGRRSHDVSVTAYVGVVQVDTKKGTVQVPAIKGAV